MLNDVITDAKTRMGQSIEHLKTELSKIRTGRAHASLLDHLKVDFYGTSTPISQAANVSVSDARTLTVQPWDKSMVSPIEKAILESDLGLNPNTAGTLIRIVIPALTEERRRDLTKVVGKEGENAKIAIRNIRRDAIQSLKEKEISQDEQRRAEGQVQELTDECVLKVDDVVRLKDAELMEI